jgi:hypothetical protein
MSIFSFISRVARAEHGFTLMETLVAMVTGVIVTGALLAILEFSLREQTQITDRTQANQLGRVAMSNIVDKLHSSCTGAKPIQEPSTTPESPLEKSNSANLWFISTYGTANSGEPLVKEVYEHDIHWTATTTSNTGEKLGRLTDYGFKSSTGNSQEGWTFPALKPSNAAGSTGKTWIIAENVILPKGKSLFEYYKYNSSGQLTELLSSELPLGSTKAAENIAKVTINFTQAPESKDTRADRMASFSDSVLMRLDPTTSEEVTPCE